MNTEQGQPVVIQVSDAELMSRLAGGDDLALNELMDRWAPRVNGFLQRMTGHRDTAVDLAEETFVKLYQSRNRYKATGAFSNYLFTIAANLARNHARWRLRHPTMSLDARNGDGSALLPESVDSNPTPEESARSAESIQTIERALVELPNDLREAITLYLYEGLSQGEIAVIAGCSIKAVETRIYRARQILKGKLQHLRT